MRWLRIAFLPVSMVTLVSAALIVPLPRYVERPGQVLSLDDCVTVGEDNQTVPGDFLLTTVNVRPATLADLARAAVQSDIQIARNLVPRGMDTGSFFRQQRQNFVNSADVAAAVGLQAAGLPVELSGGEGARILRVLPEGPAGELLRPGDVIMSVDSQRVRTDVELRRAIKARGREGQPLALAVIRSGRRLSIEVTPEILEGRLIIGVLPETVNPIVSLPVGVEVRSGSVGGSSAGLMIALTVFDKASDDVDLAAGRVIAGTGTIDLAGHVGPIGGVDLKILAAQREGAEVFLTPRVDAPAAKAALPDDSPLQIVVVDTFDQARQALVNTAPETPGEAERAGTCPYGAPA